MLIVLLLLAVLSPAAALAQNQTAIVGVTVIDVVESRTLPGMTVLIDRDRIANVAPASAVKLPTGTKTIDGAGKFLIPGLWDMHSHFTHDQSTLDLYVAYGVTTIRDMGSLAVKRTGDMTAESIPRDDAIKLDLQVRDEILSGKGFGPRIYSVGMIVTGGNAAEAGSHHIVVETPDAARAAVNKLADLRVDAIKVHARLTRESFFAIIDEAKKRALPSSVTRRSRSIPSKSAKRAKRPSSTTPVFGSTRTRMCPRTTRSKRGSATRRNTKRSRRMGRRWCRH